MPAHGRDAWVRRSRFGLCRSRMSPWERWNKIGTPRLRVKSRAERRFGSPALLASVLPIVLATVVAAHAQPLPPGAQPIPDAVWARMQGRSIRPGLPCPRRENSRPAHGALPRFYRRIPHRSADRRASRRAAGRGDLSAAYTDSGVFRIARMALIDEFGGDDDASLAANNTSAFNCRTVLGTTRLSDHALRRCYRHQPRPEPVCRRGRDRASLRGGLLRRGPPASWPQRAPRRDSSCPGTASYAPLHGMAGAGAATGATSATTSTSTRGGERRPFLVFALFGA